MLITQRTSLIFLVILPGDDGTKASGNTWSRGAGYCAIQLSVRYSRGGDIAMTHDAWLSFAYQFVIGGMLFAVPIATGLKFRVIRLERPVDRRLMLSIVGIFLFYFVLQGLWTLMALV